MRNYKYLRVASFYPEMIADFLNKHVDGSLSYLSLRTAFFSQAYAISDFYERSLKSFGNDVEVILPQVKLLQDKWRRENGVDGLDYFNTILQQIRAFSPEVVFVEDSGCFSNEQIQHIRSSVPSIKALLTWYGCPLTDASLVKLSPYDHVLTCGPEIMEQLHELNIPASYVPHGFERSILDGLMKDNIPTNSGISFIGSIIAGKGYHQNRNKILERLVLSDAELTLYGNVIQPNTDFYWLKYVAKKIAVAAISLEGTGGLKEQPLFAKAAAWNGERKLPINHLMQKKMHSALFGMDMYRAMRAYKATFNNHGDTARYAANMRLFEATGVGTCLVTDWMPNIKDFFEDDIEVVTYKSVDECLEKVLWLQENPLRAAEIAKAGQARCLRSHSIESRARIMDDVICKVLSGC